MRDIRKYFSIDFNKNSDFIKKKRKNSPLFFEECLNNYVRQFMNGQYQKVGISEEEIIFHLGSLIYPKVMIKIYKKDPKKVSQVIKIYNFLYKFSLERL